MCLDLHSSMERLKGAEDRVGHFVTLEFTFQYGEIKRQRQLPRGRVLHEFTFQYGEIKSCRKHWI